jgi:hypothetical protein
MSRNAKLSARLRKWPERCAEQRQVVRNYCLSVADPLLHILNIHCTILHLHRFTPYRLLNTPPLHTSHDHSNLYRFTPLITIHTSNSSHRHLFTPLPLHTSIASHRHTYTPVPLHISIYSHLHLVTPPHLHTSTSSHLHLFTPPPPMSCQLRCACLSSGLILGKL